MIHTVFFQPYNFSADELDKAKSGRVSPRLAVFWAIDGIEPDRNFAQADGDDRSVSVLYPFYLGFRKLQQTGSDFQIAERFLFLCARTSRRGQLVRATLWLFQRPPKCFEN